MLTRPWILLSLMAALIAGPACAGPAAEKALFTSNAPIHLTVTGPIRRLSSEEGRAGDAVEGTVAAEGEAPLPVKLSVRGITRRRSDVCRFPPLRIEFTPKVAAPSLFRGQKRLKLVTHCHEAPAYQQYVLLEYSAYRLYNLLTPESFRVRLATVDYEEQDGRLITTRPGYLIEDDGDVAKRNGLRAFKGGGGIPVEALEPKAAGRFAVFQYMIGNLDWSMLAGAAGKACCHNAKLIAAKGASSGLIPLPYDFDSAGLVDPPYAAPPEGIPVSDVRTRRYRGYCRHNVEAQAAAAEMASRRAALTAVFDELPKMDSGVRRKAVSYLDGFFDQVAGGGEPKFLRTCLG